MVGNSSLKAEGDLFPDFSRLVPNRKESGRAFSVLVESRGVGTQGVAVEFDEAAWSKARQHPSFEEDYRLSVARLLVEIAAKLHA